MVGGPTRYRMAKSATIDMLDAPMDVKAMALFNRALVHLTNGDFTRGVDDLDTVLAMNQAPAYVKKMARQKLAKRESRLRKANV